MGKRKKKSRNRQQVEPLYRRTFQEGDMVWLAREYRRQANSDPSLTLEDFAIQYAVSPDELRPYDPNLAVEAECSIALWHGTSRARAESIMKEGFKPRKVGKSLIFFTQSPALARSYANNRAKSERDCPALIMCCINLSKYNNYEVRQLQGAVVYAFRSECINSDVVNRVTGPKRKERLRFGKKPPPQRKKKREKVSEQLTDVAITFNSGRAGIAYWLNNYLKLGEADRISEDHEVVEKIKQWLDDQVEMDRFGMVPDGEMLKQVHGYVASEEASTKGEITEN